jgi:hypothetical protein
VGLTVSFVVLAIGASLAITVDTPKTGVNLQTLGLLLMVGAVTALHVILALRDPSGDQRERRSRYLLAGPSGRSPGKDT